MMMMMSKRENKTNFFGEINSFKIFDRKKNTLEHVEQVKSVNKIKIDKWIKRNRSASYTHIFFIKHGIN